MAQETRNVDYESMVDKYMNEWEGCNLREFCFSEKVNIYRMLKTMKKMGKSEMETIQILSSKLREEELENERLRRERDMESEKALRAAEDARVARESAEQYRVQLEEERRAQGDRIESMLKEVMMFITGKGTASLSESLSDSIIKKMQEQHARELAEQKAADDERYRKMDEEHRIREAALESRIRELEDVRSNNDGHDQAEVCSVHRRQICGQDCC